MKNIEKKTEKIIKPKKKYQKPQIVHAKEIETLAGSCNQNTGPCTVNF